MCETIEFNNHTMVLSLNERNVFIKVSDNINFVNYEGNVDAKELRLPFELNDIYQIIKKCISRDDGYSVAMNVNANGMRLTFHANVGGILKLQFESQLREKVLSNDGQLTMSMNKLEQKYASLLKKIEAMEKRYETTHAENTKMLDAVSNAVICILTINNNPMPGYIKSLFIPIGSTDITIYFQNIQPQEIDLMKLSYLYRLEKLTLCDYNQASLENIGCIDTLKELVIEKSDHLTSLAGIEKFPLLEKIKLSSCSGLNNVNSVVSLTTKKHAIQSITIVRCVNFMHAETLKQYCQTNNISLFI
jgi:hypothetical protein